MIEWVLIVVVEYILIVVAFVLGAYIMGGDPNE